MNTKRNIIPIFDELKVIFLIVALAGSLLSFNVDSAAADKNGTDATLADIIVSFKLDPRLTRSQYMGDRWLSSPTYTSALQVGKQAIVEARAKGRDARGKAMAISPEWIAAGPDMVAVSPGQGSVVTIIVKRIGQSRLKVVSQGVTKELRIKGMERSNGMQVQISQ